MESSRSDRFDIIQPGISISSGYSTNGTLGLIVYDKKNNYAPCILSNWHVLAKKNWRKKSYGAGAPIYQPGKNEQPIKPENIIARLTRYRQLKDAAIAKIVTREFNLAQYETNVVIKTARIPKVDDIVEKSGLVSGVTKGKVVYVNQNSGYVKIKTIKDGNPDNIEISSPGDSGSLWYDPETMEGLVLHSAGERKRDRHVAKKEFASGYMLTTVLKVLEISLTNDKTP